MNFLDLCAGIGGFSLGLEWAGMTCVGQVEIDAYCQKILKKHWPRVPKWGDIRALDPAALPAADLICGGYPCQPFSLAGKRGGEGDDRNIWPSIVPILAAVRPSWCLFENVTGHVSMGLDRVLSDLGGLGYTCQPLVIPACGVDAPHIRRRLWIIAHADRHGELQPQGGLEKERGRTCNSGQKTDMADTDGNGSPRGRICDTREMGKADEARRAAPIEGSGEIPTDLAHADLQRCEKQQSSTVPGQERRPDICAGQGWAQWPDPQRGLCPVDDGVPDRLARLKALGNAVVPRLVYEIGRAMMAAHNGEANE